MSQNARLQYLGQVFRLSAETPSVTARQVAESFVSIRPNVYSGEVQQSQVNPSSLSTSAQAQNSSTQATPTLLVRPEITVPLAAANQATAKTDGIQPNLPTPAGSTASPPTQAPQTPASPQSASLNTATTTQTSLHQPLPALSPATSIGTEGRIPTPSTERVPLELRLSQWMAVIDDIIAQSPAHLHSQIRNKARAWLEQIPSPHYNVTLSPSTESANASHAKANEDESALLALRNWLDASVARIQNNALQSATIQWTTPDTPIQQLQIPLIWLGLTHWADIEWWQEKPKADKKKKESDKQRRQWRMKIYLTLSPLAPVCADIYWTDDLTQVTFWSEEPGTLSHLNSLLPKLNTWTEGLGESQLTTKHGMPKRASQPTQETQQQHLVDIRT
jgi:hypothetical protein